MSPISPATLPVVDFAVQMAANDDSSPRWRGDELFREYVDDDLDEDLEEASDAEEDALNFEDLERAINDEVFKPPTQKHRTGKGKKTTAAAAGGGGSSGRLAVQAAKQLSVLSISGAASRSNARPAKDGTATKGTCILVCILGVFPA